MIKIYGMHTCPYCDFVKAQLAGREDEFEYIDIGTHIRHMGAFMRLRDTSPAFDHSKEIGDVGIPCFVLDDGTITLDPADVGLIEFGTSDQTMGDTANAVFSADTAGAACSIEDHKLGKHGC